MIYTVSIYKDKKDSLLLIPTAKTEVGFLTEINNPIIIEKPYSNESIGKKIKHCLETCENEPVLPIGHPKEIEKVFQIVTGIKSYSRFSKDRLLIHVCMDTEKDFTILSSVRHSDGSYRSSERYPDVKLDLTATSEQIGNVVMKAFQDLQK